jgi:nitrate reductase (NAD(P)H)
VTSAIVKPEHAEELRVAAENEQGAYELRGYAYSGGGRRVTRVEISLDDGRSFSLSEMSVPFSTPYK